MRKLKLTLLAAAATFGISTAAGAVTALVPDEVINVTNFVDASGGSVTGKSVTVNEYSTGPFSGTYELNVGSGMRVWGFGVSNSKSIAAPENNSGSCCGDARILTAANWGTEYLELYGPTLLTGQMIWGDISNVLGAGDTHFFWYDDYEVGYEGMNSGFDFSAPTASEVIVVAQGGLYGASKIAGPTTPTVPLPAAGWMLIAALGGVAAVRKSRKS